MLKVKDKKTSIKIEAIDPDSIVDAFEVIEDEIEGLFKRLKSW